MKTLIIEDEKPAAARLSRILVEQFPECEILDVIDTVEGAVKWLAHFASPDLIFMDIQLADGLSFDIFSRAEVPAPVIFTKAFDQYTLQAFKVNSIDYLLKPVDPAECKMAVEKFRKWHAAPQLVDPRLVRDLIQGMSRQDHYKSRFLIKSGVNFHYVPVEDVAYFFSEDGIAFMQCFNGKKHIIEYTLDQLEGVLDPVSFFRINRQVLVRADTIRKISPWFNSRLKLELEPASEVNLVVSRERVPAFKSWLDR